MISPGAVESELAETISDPELKRQIETYRTIAIPADTIARAIAFAIEQPAEVDANEMLIRPTSQPGRDHLSSDQGLENFDEMWAALAQFGEMGGRKRAERGFAFSCQ